MGQLQQLLYQNKGNKKINIHDSEIVQKIHELDCYFEEKQKAVELLSLLDIPNANKYKEELK